MKLLIEISDKLYNFVKSNTVGGNTRIFDDYDMYNVSRCIGHGKPIDALFDEMRTEIEEIETYDGLYIDRAFVLQILDKYKEGTYNEHG